ncbi:hypothetical protein [Roseomonas populi]|uniref:Uncharacterized protein n=1 Tax=Roseomonas populi TaxID=3121582 RepID=A0ABT1X526_9PROT|nr:hypothetical protein [Roseomonas pecuniae]MCR0983212.1 hypothetical protein [Roseomonas pecuniae]
MNEAALRMSMAAAIRTVLEEGLRKADNPVHYLRSAAEEVRQLVGLFDQDGPASRTEGALIRSILAEEVEAAAQEMIRRLHH